MESVNRSPIFDNFFETINGASTIRAYNKNETFMKENDVRIDRYQRARFPVIVTNRQACLIFSNFISLYFLEFN